MDELVSSRHLFLNKLGGGKSRPGVKEGVLSIGFIGLVSRVVQERKTWVIARGFKICQSEGLR
jgi:hypothetical protein